MNGIERTSVGMSELRQRFVLRARSDADAIIDLCGRVDRADEHEKTKPLEAISSLLHRLAGTAGTYGLEEVGLKARRLGRTVATLMDEREPDFDEALLVVCDGARDISEALESVAELAPPEPDPRGHAVPDAELVCVVSSDRDFADRLRLALHGFGYRIEVFPSVADLERVIVGLNPLAVVARLDQPEQQLPELRRVRSAQPDPSPMIVVASDAQFDDYLAAVRAGADGYFVEPLDVPRMEARLHYLVERRRRDGLRVMLVDDDVDLLSACSNILESSNLVVTQVSDPSEALSTLAKFRPEVIVMDIRMPECTGPELAQIIRMNEEWMHVPIVYMSTQSDGQDQLLATRKAGEAFIAKPIDPNELIATVCANGRHARQMLETASRDTLTGLLKHSFILEHLGAELERAQRTQGSTCAAMIDIDNFKAVNDRHGHLAGDVVIRTLATLLRQRLRVVDGIGRMGGEEFLAVFSNCGVEEATAIIQGVLDRFSQVEFAGKGESFHATFSAGIAETTGSLMISADLVGAADKALYRAKDLGRNRVERA